MTVALGMDGEKAVAELAQQGVLAGVPLKHHYPELADCILVAATELTEKKLIDALVDKLEKIAGSKK